MCGLGIEHELRLLVKPHSHSRHRIKVMKLWSVVQVKLGEHTPHIFSSNLRRRSWWWWWCTALHCSAGWARHKANMSSAFELTFRKAPPSVCQANTCCLQKLCLPLRHGRGKWRGAGWGRARGVWHGKNRWLNANKHNWISLVSGGSSWQCVQPDATAPCQTETWGTTTTAGVPLCPPLAAFFHPLSRYVPLFSFYFNFSSSARPSVRLAVC